MATARKAIVGKAKIRKSNARRGAAARAACCVPEPNKRCLRAVGTKLRCTRWRSAFHPRLASRTAPVNAGAASFARAMQAVDLAIVDYNGKEFGKPERSRQGRSGQSAKA